MVATYLLSAVGVPIYLHYCGGELEKVNVVMRSESCCDGEEHDTQNDDSCCKDENVFIKNAADFTFKHSDHASFVKTCSELFFLSLLFDASLQPKADPLNGLNQESPPPKVQNSILISTSVLRV